MYKYGDVVVKDYVVEFEGEKVTVNNSIVESDVDYEFDNMDYEFEVGYELGRLSDELMEYINKIKRYLKYKVGFMEIDNIEIERMERGSGKLGSYYFYRGDIGFNPIILNLDLWAGNLKSDIRKKLRSRFINPDRENMIYFAIFHEFGHAYDINKRFNNRPDQYEIELYKDGLAEIIQLKGTEEYYDKYFDKYFDIPFEREATGYALEWLSDFVDNIMEKRWKKSYGQRKRIERDRRVCKESDGRYCE